MSEKYDCTADVLKHKKLVSYWMEHMVVMLHARSELHDNSKLEDPDEKALFDHWSPELRKLTFGTDEYKVALDGMGEGVQRHYRANRHHPEHYENGVNGMTLIDLVEMLCDWMAAAQARSTHVDLENGAKRFGLSGQLVEIFANTLREEDFWHMLENVPIDLCPPEKREGHIETGFEPQEK